MVTALVKQDAKFPATARGISIRTFDDLQRFCGAAAASGYFKDARDVAQAIVKVQYGLEIGISPVMAMTGIHVVEGKPTVSAGIIAARIKSSGRYDYRVIRHDQTACIVAFFEVVDGKRESLGESAFTLEDAKAAGLAGKNVWKSYARAMLFARCISQGARWYTPDVFMGPVYTPEELSSGGDVDAEVIDAEVKMVDVESPPPPGAISDTQRADMRGLMRALEIKSGSLMSIIGAAPTTHAEAEAALEKLRTKLRERIPSMAAGDVDGAIEDAEATADRMGAGQE